MKFLLFLIVIFVPSEESDIPSGCFVVEHDTYEECYTFSNEVVETQPMAKNTCVSSGGQLAIIKDERTWKLLIERFLAGFAKSVWLGYIVDSSQGTKLIPTLDLRNLTNYWSSNSLSSHYRSYCLYAQQNSWKWQLTRCTDLNIPYLCQYNLSCNINDIHQPHVSSCINDKFIRHNATVKLMCERGYFLNNANAIKCNMGNLTEIPQCIRGCPLPSQKRNAILTSVKEYYNFGETVYYVCENNYLNRQNHQMTHFSITCQSDSTWADVDAGCSVKHPFSTTTVNVKAIDDRRRDEISVYNTTFKPLLTVNDVELRCDLSTNEKTWFRNGKPVSSFAANPNASLRIKLRKGDDFGGFYICTGKVNERLQVGSTAYELIEQKDCSTTQTNTVEATEGENLLLICPQENYHHLVQWFKDEERIFSNENRNIIPKTGLLLSNVSLQDEGIYKCQKESQTFCTFNNVHNVSVIATVGSVCGTKHSSDEKDQPWLAVLSHNDEIIPFCYGTLISRNWVATSAFCLVPLQRKKILDGFTIQFGPTSNKKIFHVAAVKTHPLYRPRRTPYDIGLIQLENAPLKFSNKYLPACISSEDIGNIHNCEQFVDLNGTVAGWGALVGDVNENDMCMEEMSVVSKEVCRNSKTMGFAEDKFCAKFSGGEETFAGDSGSPFLVNHGRRYYLLGIYTWGERETLTGNYDYFTSIYQHYDWIKKIIS